MEGEVSLSPASPKYDGSVNTKKYLMFYIKAFEIKKATSFQNGLTLLSLF
jgi:hypothetical protein